MSANLVVLMCVLFISRYLELGNATLTHTKAEQPVLINNQTIMFYDAEATERIEVLISVIPNLDWKTVTLIYDPTDEASVSVSAMLLAKSSFPTYLYTYESAMNIASTEFSHEQKVVLVCSLECSSDVINQASAYALEHQKDTLLRHLSHWLVLPLDVETMANSVCNETRNMSDLLTTWIQPGVLDNVAIVTNCENDYRREVSVYTAMWGDEDRYFHLEVLPLDGERFSWTTKLFPNSRFGYNGRLFLVGTLPWPPFMQMENGMYSGFCVDILEIIAVRLNFTYSFLQPEDHSYGLEVNNSWTGLMGQLVRREIDMILTDFIISMERESVADFTYPYLIDTATVVTRKSPPTRRWWWTYAFPLKPEVYICIFATFLVVFFSVIAMDVCQGRSLPDRQHSANRWQKIVDIFWYLFGIFFRQGNDWMFRELGARSLVGSWWVLTFLVTVVYMGNLIAFLTVSHEEPPFNTAMQMATETNFKWGMVKGSSYMNLFKRSNLTVHKLLHKGILEFQETDPDVFSDSQEVHFKKILNEDYAYIGGRPVINYWLSSSCQLRALKDNFFPVQYGLVFPQGSPYTDVFSEHILQLVNTGVIDRLRYTWWPANICSEGKTMGQAVSLVDALAAFCLAGAGIVLGSIALIMELLFGRFQK